MMMAIDGTCTQDNINPALDFTEVPPGILALDNIVYFAKMHGESFTKVCLNSSLIFPPS